MLEAAPPGPCLKAGGGKVVLERQPHVGVHKLARVQVHERAHVHTARHAPYTTGRLHEF